MNLLSLVVTLAVVGVLLYYVNRYIPRAPTIKFSAFRSILNGVVVVAVILWILTALGILKGF